MRVNVSACGLAQPSRLASRLASRLVCQAASGGLVRWSKFLFPLMFLTSCASRDISVTLIPGNTGRHLEVTFNRAYYAPTQSGEDQIVVVDDPIDDHLNASAGQPLPPMKGPPISQLLLIDLHWRHAPGGNTDSLVSANASFHWYVYGKPSDTTTGVLHYSGPGSVWLTRTKTGAEVRIRSEELELLDQHGPLRDPFHSFRIDTSFKAVTDPERLNAIMTEVNKVIQDADRATLPNTNPTGR